MRFIGHIAVKETNQYLRNSRIGFFVILLVFPIFGGLSSALCQQLDSTLLKKLDSISISKKTKVDQFFRKSDSIQDSAAKKFTAIENFQIGTPQSKTRSVKPNKSIAHINHKLDSSKNRLVLKIDSLTKLNLPTEKYSHFLDSVTKIGPAKTAQDAEARLQKFQQKLTKPYDNFNKSLQKGENNVNEKLSELNKEGAGLPSNVALGTSTIANTKLTPLMSNLNVPKVGNQLPSSVKSFQSVSTISNVAGKSKGLGMLKAHTTKVSKLPNQELNELKKKVPLDAAQSGLKTVKGVTNDAQVYSKEAENVVKGNLKEVKELPKTLEGKVSETALKDITTVQNQTNVLKEYHSMLANGFNKDDIKKLAEANVNKEAINHFAGKEKELTAALEQMSKYKLRYPTATEVRDITKGVRNEMAGKSFRQRALAGFNLQFQTRNDFIVDINPWAGFRLSGKWVTGLGWVERVQFHSILRTIDDGRMYGPRIFTDIKWKKGIAAHGELEYVNAYMPTVTTQDNGRMWLFGYFAGLKKDYKFSKKVKGNFQVLYNLSNYINKASPYADKINVRMGFEFGFKKR